VNRLCLLALAALVAGCASGASLDARYEQSLARWKDAPRADLVAHWGAPQARETLPDGGEALVYVVHHDDPDRRPVVTVAPGVHGGIVDSGMPIAPLAPVSCTTRFVVAGGIVKSWTFAGTGCGAPG